MDRIHNTQIQNIPQPPSDLSKYGILYQQIGEGHDGTAQTIHAMIEESVRGSVDFAIIDLARKIIQHFKVDPRDSNAIASAMFWFVKKNIQFIRDPLYAEMVQSARRTLELKCGDCDDQSTLFASLCMAVGCEVRFATIAIFNTYDFNHVFAEVDVKGDWVAYDTVAKQSVPGWHPPFYYTKAVWTIDGGMQLGLSGWFSDITGKIKDIWNKIREELSRFEKKVRQEVSKVARKLQEEKRRVFTKIAKEFERWEVKHGVLGKFMVLGVKSLIFAIAPVGLIILSQVYDNPFKFNREEWLLLTQIGSVIGSTIISIVTFGTASGLLAASVLSLVGTLASLISIQDDIKSRKKLIEQLKVEVAKYAEEERVRREAIFKLEYDIVVLEKANEKLVEYNAEVDRIKSENAFAIAHREREYAARNNGLVLQYKDQREQEYQLYCANARRTAMQKPMELAEHAVLLLQEAQGMEKILDQEVSVYKSNLGIFQRMVERMYA